MKRILQAEIIQDRVVQLRFDDGFEGTVDFSDYPSTGVFRRWEVLWCGRRGLCVQVKTFRSRTVATSCKKPAKMKGEIHPLDVVALLGDRDDLGLIVGQVGTVVELLDKETYEVKFSDEQGRTYAMAALKLAELIVLHYSPVAA